MPVKPRFDIEIYFHEILKANVVVDDCRREGGELVFIDEKLFTNQTSSPFDVSFIINVVWQKAFIVHLFAPCSAVLSKQIANE